MWIVSQKAFIFVRSVHISKRLYFIFVFILCVHVCPILNVVSAWSCEKGGLRSNNSAIKNQSQLDESRPHKKGWITNTCLVSLLLYMHGFKCVLPHCQLLLYTWFTGASNDLIASNNFYYTILNKCIIGLLFTTGCCKPLASSFLWHLWGDFESWI